MLDLFVDLLVNAHVVRAYDHERHVTDQFLHIFGVLHVEFRTDELWQYFSIFFMTMLAVFSVFLKCLSMIRRMNSERYCV